MLEGSGNGLLSVVWRLLYATTFSIQDHNNLSSSLRVCVCVFSIMAMHPEAMGRYYAPTKYILLHYSSSNSEANYENCSSIA